MDVAKLREQLRQIPGSLIDIPPEESWAGNDEGVVGSTLYSPFDADYGSYEISPPNMDEDGDEDADADGVFEPVFEWGAHSEEMLQKLGDAVDESIRQSVIAESGSDALGHYLSFHVLGAQWGATVNLSGIAWLVRNYFTTLPRDDLTHFRLAFHAILQHELFHFATDVAITQAELGQREAWWNPATSARNARGDAYSHLEEKLANVWMLRAFRTALPGYQVRGKQSALKSFVGMQPPGYRDALNFDAKHWRPALQKLAEGYATDAGCVDHNLLLWGEGYDWACQFPVWPRIDWRNCAIHLVDDSARFNIPSGWLTFLSCLQAIEESDRFRKQLGKLPARQQRNWDTAKGRAMTALTSGHDFKVWPKGGKNVWAMRVDRAYRAHLLRDQARNKWVAFEIGDHKSMGHG